MVIGWHGRLRPGRHENRVKERLAHSQFAEATCSTFRLKPGALVQASARQIKIAMAPAYLWRDALARLRNVIAWPRT